MKTKLITLVAITLINFCAQAQTNSKDSFKTSSGIERIVGNNTAILVSYDNKVPAVIKGPFEYACKLYSEVLPTSFP